MLATAWKGQVPEGQQKLKEGNQSSKSKYSYTVIITILPIFKFNTIVKKSKTLLSLPAQRDAKRAY